MSEALGEWGKDVICECVFCGWPKAKLYPQRVGSYRRTGENWQVVCNKCRARGPLDKDSYMAVTRWNAAKEQHRNDDARYREALAD